MDDLFKTRAGECGCDDETSLPVTNPLFRTNSDIGCCSSSSSGGGAGIDDNVTSLLTTWSSVKIVQELLALSGDYVPLARTLTINGTALDLSADRSWNVGTVTSIGLTAGTGISVSGGPITSSGNITVVNTAPDQVVAISAGYGIGITGTYPNFTVASTLTGDYITQLTGEATAIGPGSVPITLVNSAVIGKVLTGLNITGGTIVATDTILQAFGKAQNQLSALLGGVTFQTVWNASTNTPTLTSSTGTKGHYYIVNVDGATNLDGITDWKVGDWAIFNGTTWDKVDNTDAVSSVNGYTAAVSLVTGDVLEGAGVLPGRPSNLYYTDARARAAISLTTTGSSGTATYNSTTGVFNIPDYGSALSGYVPYTGATGSVTLGSYNLTANDLNATNSINLSKNQDGYTTATISNTDITDNATAQLDLTNGTQTLRIIQYGVSYSGPAGGAQIIASTDLHIAAMNGASKIWLSPGTGGVEFGSLTNAGTDTDRFAVFDSNSAIRFRTGTQLLSDIGGIATADAIQNQIASTQTAGFKISGDGTLANLTASTKVNVGSPSGTTGSVNTGQDGIYSYRSAGRYVRFNTSGTFNDFLSLGAKLVMNYGFSGTVENISMFEGSAAGDGQFIVGSPTATNARFLLKGKDTGTTNYISRWFDSGNTEKFSVRNDGQTTVASLSAGGIVKSTAGVLNIATAGTDYLLPASLSATSPIFYNSGTGVISSQAASHAAEGYVTTGSQLFAGIKNFVSGEVNIGSTTSYAGLGIGRSSSTYGATIVFGNGYTLGSSIFQSWGMGMYGGTSDFHIGRNSSAPDFVISNSTGIATFYNQVVVDKTTNGAITHLDLVNTDAGASASARTSLTVNGGTFSTRKYGAGTAIPGGVEIINSNGHIASYTIGGDITNWVYATSSTYRAGLLAGLQQQFLGGGNYLYFNDATPRLGAVLEVLAPSGILKFRTTNNVTGASGATASLVDVFTIANDGLLTGIKANFQTSATGFAIEGTSTSASSAGGVAGYVSTSNGVALFGQANAGAGVSAYGVWGTTNGTGYGVFGQATAGGNGGYFTSNSGEGIFVSSVSGIIARFYNASTLVVPLTVNLTNAEIGNAYLSFQTSFTGTEVAGSIYKRSSDGLVLYSASGVTNDFTVYNGSGSTVMVVPTGTINSKFSGGVALGGATPYTATNYNFLTTTGTSGSGVMMQTSGTNRATVYGTSSGLWLEGATITLGNSGYVSSSSVNVLVPLTGTTGTFTDGSQGLIIRPYTGGSGVGAIYSSTVTPGNDNYSFAALSGYTILRGGLSGYIRFDAGGATRGSFESNGQFQVNSFNGAGVYGVVVNSTSDTGTQYLVEFTRIGTQAGYIASTSSTTVGIFNTSDYRTKEDFLSFSGTDLLKAMNFYDFKWKDSGIRDYGVIAHELQGVLPNAVIGEKDGERNQAVDYVKLVPIYGKAIQEQQVKISDTDKALQEALIRIEELERRLNIN